MSEKTTTSKKLANLLVERSMSQKELRGLLDAKFPLVPKIGYDVLSRIITGKHQNFTIKLAKRIATVLDVKIDDIIDEDINLDKK